MGVILVYVLANFTPHSKFTALYAAAQGPNVSFASRL